MKYLKIVLTAITVSSILGCASNNNIDTSNLVLVKENHATIIRDGNSYILDSYIIPFQQPYYITVKRNDKKPISLTEASEVAEEYIQPRGCTEPLARRPDLDKSNADKTQWLIGVEC
ncbi:MULTISPECIES: hypothetical protein [Pseudomonas]|uniref:hypothetical protein n=1 Tax=Pseudomonas TaxID=286 RepID=UPI001112F047|nr:MULTISPECIES: hypothetical protein [Pseudomonas]